MFMLYIGDDECISIKRSCVILDAWRPTVETHKDIHHKMAVQHFKSINFDPGIYCSTKCSQEHITHNFYKLP